MAELTVTGHIGRDAEVKETTAGQTRVVFTMADKQQKKGDQEEPPVWREVSIWGRYGLEIQPFLVKGMQVTICNGREGHRTYQGTDGQTNFVRTVSVDAYRSAISWEHPKNAQGNTPPSPAPAPAASAPRQAPPPYQPRPSAAPTPASQAGAQATPTLDDDDPFGDGD